MKKTVWTSYLDGVQFKTPGESYRSIINFFAPEVVTALVAYALIPLIDGAFISCLPHSEAYATLSITKSLMHCITKLAEGVSVGAMVMCGIAHGQDDPSAVGRAWGTVTALTLLLGFSIALFIACMPGYIMSCMRVPLPLRVVAIPFLRIRAISVFLMFIFFSMIGLLRGLKRNKIATHCMIVGTLVFVIADYLFIFGRCGMPQLAFSGSAVASILQYISMIFVVLRYLYDDPRLYAYLCMVQWVGWHALWRLFMLSVPVMIDKVLLAVAKVFLLRCIAPMGGAALSSFGVIGDIEMLMFVPAIAYAQVVTGLVSNEVGARDIIGIKYTIKKVLLLAITSALIMLVITSWFAESLIGFFDAQCIFRYFAIPAFRWISLLALFDVVQVVLSAALRGCAQMQTVLRVRAFTLLFFCFPIAYAASLVAFKSDFVRFMTIYGSFYISNGFMALWYIIWLRSERWSQEIV